MIPIDKISRDLYGKNISYYSACNYGLKNTRELYERYHNINAVSNHHDSFMDYKRTINRVAKFYRNWSDEKYGLENFTGFIFDGTQIQYFYELTTAMNILDISEEIKRAVEQGYDAAYCKNSVWWLRMGDDDDDEY